MSELGNGVAGATAVVCELVSDSQKTVHDLLHIRVSIETNGVVSQILE